jgi:PAS domain S-box-containing protein
MHNYHTIPTSSTLAAIPGIAIVATDDQGIITLYNDYAGKLLGYPGEHTGQTPVISQLQAEIVNFRQSLATEAYPAAERSLKVLNWVDHRRGRQETPLNLVIAAMPGYAQKPEGFLVLITETKRKPKAEEYLRIHRNESRMAQAGEPEPETGLFVIDANGKCLYADALVQQITGLSASELTGNGWNRMMHFEDQQAFMQITQPNEVLSSTIRIIKPDQRICTTTLKRMLIQHHDVQLGIVGAITREPSEYETASRFAIEKVMPEAEVVSDDVIVALHEPSGRFSYLSPAVTKLLGYAPEELTGTSPCVLFHPEDRITIRQQIHQLCIDAHQNRRIQCRVRKKDNSYTNAIVKVQSVLDTDGNVVHLQTTASLVNTVSPAAQRSQLLETFNTALVNYINGQYTAEHLLDELLQVIIQITGSTYGLAGRLLGNDQQNPALAVISVQETSWNEKVRGYYRQHPSRAIDIYGLRAHYLHTIRSGKPYMVNPDVIADEQAFHSFLALPLRNGNQLVGVIGIANCPEGYSESTIQMLTPLLSVYTTIIASLKHSGVSTSVTQLSIIPSTNLQSSLTDNLDTALCVVDKRTLRVRYVNYAFCRLWRLEHLEDMLRSGKLLYESVLPHLESVLKNAASNLRLPDAKTVSIPDREILLITGQTLRWKVMATSTAGETDENWLLQFDDITEQKHRENELILAKQQAEEAATAKQQFLSAMSHEIRTPMNAVIGMTHLLMQENPRPDQLENLKTLKFSSDNLLVLINDILDFSKIEAGKITFEEIDFNLHELIFNIRNSLIYRANEKGIQIKIHIDPAVPELLAGDPVRLAQILNNLLSNAIKFTDEGMVAVEVGLSSNTSETVHIRFSVQDTGIGISQDKLEYIFESFTQANSDVTRRFGGTGLGLTITKSLLELQDSQIHVESKVGEGSTFYFTLGFKKSQKKQLVVPIEQINYNIDLSHVRLLLVEDNQINQIVATKFLSQLKLQPDFASNGKIAVDKVQSKEYDIILMDLEMPEMNGFEATEAIRNLGSEWYRQIPIIAVSAAVVDDTRERAVRAGITDFTSKPINPSELYQKILKYVSPDPITLVPPAAEPEISVPPVNAGQLNYKNLLQICAGDQDAQQQLLILATNSFIQFKNTYQQALSARDVRKLESSNHYMKTLFHVLETTDLMKEIQISKELLADPGTPHTAFSGTISRVSRMCDTIIAGLEELQRTQA